MKVYKIDPCADSRWADFVQRHPDAAIFHTPYWLMALKQTYGYTSVAYTTAAPGDPIDNGIPFCRINSILTGRRLVSLPFADHCQPLVDSEESLRAILDQATADAKASGCKYVELRPLKLEVQSEKIPGFGPYSKCHFHQIDLTPSLDELHKNLHSSSVVRKIRRSVREELTCEEGRDNKLLKQFYDLQLMTRRKHGLPPQPLIWFQNLLSELGDHALVRVASKEGRPIASIITSTFGDRCIYKYGASDPTATNMGGTPMLFWKAISDAKEQGCRWFDMGRSDLDNPGLVTFKERWGATGSELTYLRSPAPAQLDDGQESGKMKIAKAVFSRLPDPLLVATGRMLYRHIG